MGNPHNAMVAVIEFGTDKIAALYGGLNEYGEPQVYAFASRPSDGCVEKGTVCNWEKARKILNEVLAETLDICPQIRNYCKNVYFPTNGISLKTTRINGKVHLNPQEPITLEQREAAVARAIENYTQGDNVESFNSFEGFFILDNSSRVANPVGHTARELDAYLQILTIDKSAYQGIVKLLVESGFDANVPDTFYCAAAAAYAVTEPVDEENGVLVIDFGRGSCNYILLNGDGIYACGNVPVGTDHLANDLSIGLHLDFNTCSEFVSRKMLGRLRNGKVNYVHCVNRQIQMDGMPKVTIPENAEVRDIPRQSFETILSERLRETFGIIHKNLENRGVLNHFESGIILTGGGALLDDVPETASRVFGLRVRIGNILGVNNMPEEMQKGGPRYAALAGLLKKACENLNQEPKESTLDAVGNFVSGLGNSVLGYFSRFKSNKKKNE